MKFYKKSILTLLITINFTNVFSGLLPEAMVFMGNGTYKKAKNLKVGDYLPVYNIPTHQLERQRQKIQEITTLETKKIVLIKTENETLVVGTKQKLYNRRTKWFIPAKEFRVGDMLFSPEKGNRTITNISRETLEDKIKLYNIALEDCNLFLILTPEKTHILVHDFPLPVTLDFFTGQNACNFGKFIVEAFTSVFHGISNARGIV